MPRITNNAGQIIGYARGDSFTKEDLSRIVSNLRHFYFLSRYYDPVADLKPFKFPQSVLTYSPGSSTVSQEPYWLTMMAMFLTFSESMVTTLP